MKIFSTVADLAASKLTADQIVSVKEVGEYRIKASGSGITLANANIAVPVASGTSVNVKQFGAIGDGVTDDTAAIQAAIDAADTVIIPEDCNLKVTSGLTLNDNNNLIGSNRYTSKITFSDYATGSYLNAFSLNNNITLENFSVEFSVPSGAVGALCFVFPATTTSNLRFDKLNVDMGSVESGGVLNTTNHLFYTALSGSASQVTITDCYFTKFKFGILQTNTSTFSSYYWKIDGNHFQNFFAPALTINCPAGDADNVVITNNFLQDSLAYTTGDFEHMGGLAGGSGAGKFIFSGNVLSGTGQGWHFEEGAGNVTINGDTFNINDTAIQILDSNVGGPTLIPSEFIITNNNIVNTSGSPAGRGIELVYDVSGSAPLVNSIISNNYIYNWDRGISLGESSNTLLITGNLIRGCTAGIRATYFAGGVKDNQFQDCTTCFLVTDRGGYIDEITYDSGTPISSTSSNEGTVNKLNLNKDPFTLVNGTSDIILFPASSATEFDGLLTLRLYTIGINRRNLSYDVTFDGTTLTPTARLVSGAGAVTVTGLAIVSNNLVLQVNNTTGGDIANCAFSATFTGFYATT